MRYANMLAAVAIAGCFAPPTAAPPTPRQPPGGPQPGLSARERERRQMYNRSDRIDKGEPANMASLPKKKQAKIKRQVKARKGGR